MTTYHPYKVNLSKGQKDKLRKAFQSKNPVTLRLKKTQLSGNDQLMLTANQIKRIKKAASQGKGAEIKVTKTQAQKVGRKFCFCPFSPGSFVSTHPGKNTWTFSFGWFGE